MNLEKLNLIELDAREEQETEGGFLAVLAAIATVTAVAVAIYGAGYAVGCAVGHYRNNN